MKVIISRKGFDSVNGGYPSPVLPNGRMISLPIPSDDKIKYSNLRVDESLTYFDLMKQFKQYFTYKKHRYVLTENSQCHLDPDINRSVMKRHTSWKPLFGQIDAAQGHLKNKGVKDDDLFLFFGTFRKTIKREGRYEVDSSKEFHAIYGYLQIGKKLLLNNHSTEFPEWIDYHPHTAPSYLKGNNTVYIARDRLTLIPEMPGAGVLNFADKLILTKTGYSKSRWALPSFFKDIKITYHSEQSWKNDYFQSVGMGQEFIINSNSKIDDWVKYILKKE